MGIAKVIVNGITTMDVTQTTATADKILQGYGCIGADGEWIDGTATGGGSTPTLQAKSVSYTPSETAQSATVTADSGYDGLSSVDVSVGAIASDYVGSGITRRSSSDLTEASGGVTVPAGYYAEDASYWLTTANIALDSHSINASGYESVSFRATTSGYAEGVFYGGWQLDTQAAATITPSTTAQTAVAAGKYTTGAVTVAAMPSGTEGTPTATKGSVSNHAISVTPSVTNSAGYIEGGTRTGTAVTVSASELVSGSQTLTDNGTVDVTNLASVTVDIDFVTYHTSSSDPTSSQGSDGDIWLVTA